MDTAPDVEMGGVPTTALSGTKRKAESQPDESRALRRIKVGKYEAASHCGLTHSPDSPANIVLQALDPKVGNKIAAGEISVAPVHALKELIGNAVDAGATSLDVLAKEGGLKLLQITDNGCGIQVNDFAYAHILARLTCATER